LIIKNPHIRSPTSACGWATSGSRLRFPTTLHKFCVVIWLK